MATIKDVAFKAGVSTATVSHVLNKTRYVSEEVQKRVFTAIQEVHYIPNRSARNLRSKKSGLLGVILFSNLNPYFAEVLQWINTACVKMGFSTLVSYPSSEEDELLVVDSLLSRDVEGLILNIHGPDNRVLDYLKELDKPYVVLNRNIPLENSCTISNDDVGGTQAGMKYLWSLGHRRIGFITYPAEDCQTYSKRALSYKNFLEEKGAFDPDLIYWGDINKESSYDALTTFLALPDPPTVIFCCSDVLAMGLYKAAYLKGLSIPRDLSVLGFDDIDLARYMIPPLTTIAQDKKLIGELCVNIVLGLLSGSGGYLHETVKCSLVQRASVRCLQGVE